MQYTKINIKYCSSDFSEVIGVTEDNKAIAAFVCANSFMHTSYSISNQIHVTSDCIFEIDAIDYNIIPFMKYGSIALILDIMFPNNDYELTCNKAILKLFKSIVNYAHPAATNRTSKRKHRVTLNKNILIIDDTTYDLDELNILDIIPRDIISTAIKKTDQCDVIIEELPHAIHTYNENKNGVFFKIIKM